MIGATHTLTDAAYLSEYFQERGIKTCVIGIPSSIDGNINEKYVEVSIGFDTASKVYSQLIGNLMTDSSSASKYWYFIRLMGKNPSHLALECALQTQPNMVDLFESKA
jgi:6-phosphofructokinase